MVVIDNPDAKGWPHLAASSIEELHNFASAINLNKCWFQNKKGKKQPHYDVRSSMRNLAIENGAVLLEKQSKIIEFLKENYG